MYRQRAAVFVDGAIVAVAAVVGHAGWVQTVREGFQGTAAKFAFEPVVVVGVADELARLQLGFRSLGLGRCGDGRARELGFVVDGVVLHDVVLCRADGGRAAIRFFGVIVSWSESVGVVVPIVLLLVLALAAPVDEEENQGREEKTA